MQMPRFRRRKPRRAPGYSGTPAPPANAKARRRARFQRLMLGLSFAVLLAALTKFSTVSWTPQASKNVVPGEVARETVQARFRFESEDIAETRDLRAAAAEAVPETYSVDVERVENRIKTVQERIGAILGAREDMDEAIREALRESTSEQEQADVVEEAVAGVAAELAGAPPLEDVAPGALAVWLTPSAGSVPRREFEPRAEDGPDNGPRPVAGLLEPEQTPLKFAHENLLTQTVPQTLEYILTRGVLSPEEQAHKQGRGGEVRIIRDRRLEDLDLSAVLSIEDVPRPSEARDALRARLSEALDETAGEGAAGEEQFLALLEGAWSLVGDAVTETLAFDQVATTREREVARKNAEAVTREIKAYETIQEEGRKWTEQSVKDAQTYWLILAGSQRNVTSMLSSLAAHVVLILLALACLVRYTVTYSEAGSADRNQNLALLLLCSTVVFGRAAYYFDPSGLVVPVTATAILYAILVRARPAIMVSFLTATLVSVQYGYDWTLLVTACAMSFSAVFSIYVVRRRSDMQRAAFKAAAVGILVVLATMAAADNLFDESTVRRALLVGLNGLLCVFIVPGVLSALERLFKITTDIQLLEYSDLNNEILSQMAIEAPATYAHSLMIGQLAEAAAQAIGANGLLARVCAYYHDIGKMRRPDYFSENQSGPNIHDDLPPRLSARAIASHVSHGAAVAREHHLPQPVIDAIYEHHGTMLISFFYSQALEQQKHGDVREADFRYPGPRPRSRENAILMVCDAVESGVRSMKNPNEERVREFVDKIVSSRAEDRQFDECPLTLKDLDVISDVVSRRVLSTLHPRIAYPEQPSKNKAENVVPIQGGQER